MNKSMIIKEDGKDFRTNNPKLDLEEKENHIIWIEKKSSKFVLIGVFTALSVVIGYMLAYLPNIELFTLMIFLSGFMLGSFKFTYKKGFVHYLIFPFIYLVSFCGTIVGFFSSLIFAIFNPFGPSPLLLMVVQLIYYSLVGFLGGLTKKYLDTKDYFNPNKDLYVLKIILLFALLGGVMTFSYDIISTFVGSVSFGIPFIPYYLSGIVFTTLHLIGNVLGFIFILPILIQLIGKLFY